MRGDQSGGTYSRSSPRHPSSSPLRWPWRHWQQLLLPLSPPPAPAPSLVVALIWFRGRIPWFHVESGRLEARMGPLEDS